MQSKKNGRFRHISYYPPWNYGGLARHSRRNKHARSMYRLRRRHTAPFCVHEGNPLAYRPSSRTGSMSGQPVRPTRPCLYWRPCRLLYALP